MKNYYLTLLSIFIFSFVYAHPPKSVKITHNKAEKSITIEIDHKVKSVDSHYIDIITIFVNEEEKDKISLNKQSNLTAEKQVYKIADLKPGDVIKVTAGCNKFGSRSSEITIK